MTEAILANTPVGIAIFDSDRTIRRVNKQYCSIYGMDERQLVGQSARILYQSQEQCDDIGDRAYPLVVAGGTFNEDAPMRRNDGQEIWLHLTARLVDPADRTAGIVWAVEDITERKAAEARIQRLSNLFAALSQCNQAIVRCKNETELFPLICRDAVEFGGMKIAWIGLVDGPSKEVRLVASFGDSTGFLQHLHTSADGSDPYGRGSSGNAIRRNEPYWCQDFQNDPAMAPWYDYGKAVGILSLASLPLLCNGVPVGCLTLYSGTVNAFDEDARKLLIEMAMDISFALDTFAHEAERQRVTEALRVAATAFESQEGMVITDADKVILQVNKAFVALTGYAADEIVGEKIGVLRTDRQNAETYAPIWQEVARNGSWRGDVWNRRKGGVEFPAWLTITAVTGQAGEITHYVAAFTDTSRLKASEEEIKYLAFYDPLTGLPNRRLLLDRLQQALAASIRSKRDGALLFIDLDNFKTVNDTLGHDKGDLLLQQVAERLPYCLRDGDTVARLGGDDFIVILEDLSDSPAGSAVRAEIVGEKILASLSQPYQLAGYECYCTASVGITLFGDPPENKEETLKQAELAMYQAKAAGTTVMRFFDPGMQASVSARATLEAGLRQALRQQAFFLCYQPQVDSENRTLGAEVLVRWRHPDRGVVSPTEFIPVAEETGLILPLGRWVLETACTQLVRWSVRKETADLTLAVNVSARQFRQPDFVADVLMILSKTGADPRKLKLELTESLVLDDVEDIIAKMTALKACGVEFSFDDFGTGYSSLSYLKRLPLSQLKVDRSFVRDVLNDSSDAAVVRTIVVLAKSMGLHVIAEGVETEGQRQFLASQGCFNYQGFLFGRPLLIEDFERSLHAAPRTLD
ncbi:EAL domain-containing protein [Telmatospirillum sp.]|uniref:bifunctional diguanylate cyclase/phosphodiesterase n=1 Tax=Telmatospirillum sp. TaxID=2079197 RepID=UPI00284A223D|nr:EAL domain-containing protein [Telmatospirillum sp.]MDR3435512.1 EAL domain-containing protein [Telmatospirillum sp.]